MLSLCGISVLSRFLIRCLRGSAWVCSTSLFSCQEELGMMMPFNQANGCEREVLGTYPQRIVCLVALLAAAPCCVWMMVN